MNRRDRRRAPRPAPLSARKRPRAPRGERSVSIRIEDLFGCNVAGFGRKVGVDPRHRLPAAYLRQGFAGSDNGGQPPPPLQQPLGGLRHIALFEPDDPTRLLGADRFDHGLQHPRRERARSSRRRWPILSRSCPARPPSPECRPAPMRRIAGRADSTRRGGRLRRWSVVAGLPDPGAEGSAFPVPRDSRGDPGAPSGEDVRTNECCVHVEDGNLVHLVPTPAASRSLRGRHMAGSNADLIRRTSAGLDEAGGFQSGSSLKRLGVQVE